MPMPTPKQISLDLDDEVPAPVAIPPECKPTLIDLMAQAIVAVWRRSAQALRAELPRAACRRDTGVDAGPWRGVIYEFCLGRGPQYPVALLGASQGPRGSPMEEQPAWRGTLVCDQYAGYDAVLDKRVYPQRIAAHCAAHARRKFDELLGTSEVAKDAIKRIG